MESHNAAFHIEGQCVFKNIGINDLPQICFGSRKDEARGEKTTLFSLGDFVEEGDFLGTV